MSVWQYANPVKFLHLSGKIVPTLAVISTVCLVAGLFWGFFLTPDDYKQGSTVKIIYIHVPVSWMAMLIYLAMAFWSVLGLVFQTRLSGDFYKGFAHDDS